MMEITEAKFISVRFIRERGKNISQSETVA